MTPEHCPDVERLQAEAGQWRERAEAAEEALRAIREGEVDAIVVSGGEGERVYSLSGVETVYRRIVETMHEAALTVGCEDDRILFANARFAALVGTPLDQVIGRVIHEFVAPEQHRVINALLRKGQTEGIQDRVLVRGADGTAIPLYLSANALEQDDGCCICLVGADLSELEASSRQVAELGAQRDMLRRARAETERQVQERTAELRNTVAQLEAEIARRREAEVALSGRSEQLRTLAAQLTVAEQRERQRLGSVLHDGIQQLLVGCRLRVSMLERAADPAGMQEGCRELTRLLDEALAASRSLTAELSPSVLHVGGLNAAFEWLVSWMQETYGLRVDFTADGALPIEDEPTKLLLFQSVRELLFNVVKHAEVSRATLATRVDGQDIAIVVADAGAGFDPAAIQPIGISGLGMRSIQERLAFLGGRMEIDAAPGRGSRFTLTVPQRAAVHSTRTAAAPAQEAAARRRIRVLVADDHQVVREAVARMLSAEPDLQVVAEASDGEEAVTLTRTFLPDIVIMDVNMPGTDGVEATRRIRAECPDVQVIALSMYGAEGGHGKQMEDAGATAYLSKSGPSEVLLATVRAYGCRR